MANIINRQQTFSTNGTVTAAGLHNLIDTALVNSAIIKNQQEITTIGTADLLLIAPDSVDASLAPRKVTVQNLFDDGLTAGTFTSFNLTGALTYGTATGNRTVSTSATITTGTIPNLTAGTTTSTAATITNGTITSGTITTALIPTLTAGTTTGTAGIFTSGTVATLNSTTGTITNLSTTLAGDFTISQGTGTLGTTGATLGTYGGATSVPVLAINAKGQVTSTGTAAITSGLTGFRNRIINGDMRIDQRNAGASVTPTTDSTYTIDRWCARLTQASKFSIAQNAGSVTPPSGFTKYIGATSLSSFSVGTGDFFAIEQRIEGQNVDDLAWGTAGAKAVTLSFWVRSSLTGTFGGAFNNGGATARSYPFSYTISSANTWEQKTISISGDTSGTWLTTSGLGMQIFFAIGVGSTYSATAGAWNGGNASIGGYVSATGATSVVGTNGATFYITGVQFEVGSTATEFERRPIGTELALCQRYYEQTGKNQVYSNFGVGSNYATTGAFVLYTFKTTKRTLPTMVTTGTAGNYGVLYGAGSGQACSAVPNINSTNSSLDVAFIEVSVASGLTIGQAVFLRADNNNSAFLGFSAEL